MDVSIYVNYSFFCCFFLFDFLLTEVCATYNEYGNPLYTSLWNVY